MTTAYDAVGTYQQDEVNGFTAAELGLLVALIEAKPQEKILDAMGGNGNLAKRVLADYRQRSPDPLPCVRVLEYSKVQCALADANLQGLATVLHASILDLEPTGTYDTVVIKSGLHELPWASQRLAMARCTAALRPGGKLIALDLVFPTGDQRDEFAYLALVKDACAGMHEACENRYFVTQAEWKTLFQHAGLLHMKTRAITYRIDPVIVAAQYFPKCPRLHGYFLHIFTNELRASWALQAAGYTDGCTLRCPGRITVGIRPMVYMP
jgi:SAM-dependent methyltransferase